MKLLLLEEVLAFMQHSSTFFQHQKVDISTLVTVYMYNPQKAWQSTLYSLKLSILLKYTESILSHA